MPASATTGSPPTNAPSWWRCARRTPSSSGPTTYCGRPRLFSRRNSTRPHLGIECVLRELHIASSTYYRWRRAEKEPCERRCRNVELTERIKETHAESGGNYGSPRVHAALRREGTRVGRKQVERLMREADIAGVSPRRKGFTRRDPKDTIDTKRGLSAGGARTGYPSVVRVGTGRPVRSDTGRVRLRCAERRRPEHRSHRPGRTGSPVPRPSRWPGR